MTNSTSDSIESFVNLIDDYLEGRLPADVFETKYLELWRSCRDSGSDVWDNEESAHLIDSVFLALDRYCHDPALRDEDDIDDEELKHIIDSELAEYKK